MAVDALLAQDRDLRARCRRAPALAGRARIERRAGEMDVQPGVVDAAGRLVLGVGALGVVAQAADAPADLVPGLVQVAQRRAEHRLRVAPDLDDRARVGLADDVAVLAQAGLAQDPHRLVAARRRHLDDRAELFVEERAQRQLLAPRAHLLRPVLGVAVLGAAVGDAVALGDEQVDVEADAEVAGEGHLARRRPEAAVAAVVVREQQAGIAQAA